MKATYIDHMGTDLSVVNAARVSFGKTSKEFSKADEGLIKFLARGCTSGDWEDIRDEIIHGESCWEEVDEILRHIKNMPTHWTPFGHTAITLHIKAPIFVARQLGKHQAGMVWNEVSRRYVSDEPEFYVPEKWRKAANNVKQGSSDEKVWVDAIQAPGIFSDETLGEELEVYGKRLNDLYQDMIDNGVCAEQARMVLPQSMYTEWYWTGNLYSFANVFIQRTDSHAQREVQGIAHQIGEIIEPLFPVSWKALTA